MRRALIAAVLAVLALAGVTVAATRSHPTDGLPAVAEAAWRAHNEYLVTGVLPAADPAYDAWLRSRAALLDKRRNDLAEGGVAYVAQRTRLVKVEDVFARRDRARITVTIDTELDIRGPEGSPPYTGSNEELEFHFRWDGGAWVLRDVRPLGHG